MTTIIYLIGRSGSGKYTIAKQLEKYGFKVVDNHLVNNPIFALLDLDGVTPIPDRAWDTIAQIRTHVFDFISQERKHSYVLTNELLDDEGDRKLFSQVQKMAEKRGSLFIPVRLHISKEENARRIQMPERALRLKSTRIDEKAYEKLLIQVSHPNMMDIDINQLTPEVVAEQIMETGDKLLKLPSTRFVEPALLEEAVDILKKRFEAPIQIKSVQFISEPERRNVLLRIALENPQNGVPSSLILKQALHQESSNEDKEALGRFARDWAGLEFLSAHSSTGSPIVPKVYGGSPQHRFVLLEDLGEVHVSLVDALMGTDKEGAIQALRRFAQTLGQHHADAYGHVEKYKELLKNLNPDADYWLDYLEDMISQVKPVLEKLNISLTADSQREIEQIYKICKESNHFTTLVHGDICPDNVFDDPDRNMMHIIDFEWGFVGNALLDGTYLRMSNPTCWCVKALPEEIIEPLEALYRQELIKKIPAARDDGLYGDAYLSACAYWMLWRVTGVENILEADIDVHTDKLFLHPKWKPEDKLQRPRTLARIEAFIKVSKKHDRLPHLRHMAEQILKELKSRWVDVKPLDLYPAFK